MKHFNDTGSINNIKYLNNTSNDINNSIKNLKSLFLKLNNGKLNKEQKRSLTSLYNQLIKLNKKEMLL
jgi:hypothetical protein